MAAALWFPLRGPIWSRASSINDDAGKEPAQRRFVVLPVEVVIAPDFDVAGLLGIAVMKCGQPLVNRGVGDVDLIEAFDFPEFLRVAQLDQRESFRKVIIEGTFEDPHRLP